VIFLCRPLNGEGKIQPLCDLGVLSEAGGATIKRGPKMLPVNEGDILTKIVRYNLIRNERLIYIDVHETKAGSLAGKFVAVPNLINIVARQEFQGTGETEAQALENCLQKIKDFEIEDLFPQKE
jgi:hypothetical protein